MRVGVVHIYHTYLYSDIGLYFVQYLCAVSIYKSFYVIHCYILYGTTVWMTQLECSILSISLKNQNNIEQEKI